MPAAIAAAGAIAYLVVAPPSADHAAQAFRADTGLNVVDTAWFGGLHLPSYSVLFPPLGALVGERVVGAVAAFAATAAFGALAGARLAVWFAPAVLAALVSGRITFVLGAAFGVAAVLAANPRPPSEKGQAPFAGWLRVASLGVLTALASPVAALFAGVAGAALAIAGARRALGAVLAVAVAVPTVALAVAFPTGGDFPFAVSAFLPAFVAGVAVAVAAPRGSALAIGAALYALLCLVVFVLPTPVGGNATRLGTLVAVPVAVHLLWPQRRVVLAVLAVPLAYWVLQPAVRDVARTAGDPSVDAAFHRPLVEALRGAGPVRVEVPLTRNKYEAVHLARHVPLARGWERQLDRKRNALFYEGELTPERYARWLRENGVARVALPLGVDFDEAGEAEARLVASAPPFLRELDRAGDWRVFAVRGAEQLGVASLDRGGFTVARGGVVRVRFTPYWQITSGRGCVGRARGGWTQVGIGGAGRPVEVRARFAPGRIGAESPRCR